MGLVSDFMGMLFGHNRNVLVETAQVFRENSENAGVRQAALPLAAPDDGLWHIGATWLCDVVA